ncbi:hypothetical protein QR680_009032 [Steinernema hermaphroditum]|uniref:Histone-lysine N-methyltransferase, H3 lysine-79 specific n=1 Tax=Steinernema hermaphroditum TaxID=289476 RepID=A0AA39M8P7_9BILA|nr:hypothetical protein QR680_009032 [Steinernema hermaphroditum]
MKRGASVKASRQQPSPKLAKKAPPASPPDAMQTLKLHSCAGGEPLTFTLSEADQVHVGAEIVEIIRLAKLQFRELYQVLQPVSDPDVSKFEELQLLCHKFNKAAATISSLWKGATKPGDEKFADEKFLKQICTRAYNRAVTDVSALNKHYEAFSSETYGETSFERLQMIIEEVAPKEDDVFVDLGSGVGQLIIQMAGGSRVKKAIGIEISQLPNKFAKQLEVEFVRLMKWYGKKYRPFAMEHGDFLEPKYRQLITEEATIIFINNFAFTSELDARIKRELLSELKDGTRIITTKPYALPGRSTNGRHMNDISMILDVKEMRRCENACSWTSNYVAYFIHTINHSRIELYYQNQRNPQSRALSSENSRRSSVSHRSSRESSVMSSSNSGRHVEDDPVGPTTRRKWSEQVGEEPKKAKVKEKKPKKAILRGRPRKSAPMSSCGASFAPTLGGSRLSSDAIDGLQQMHNMSRDIPMHFVKTEDDESLAKADLATGRTHSSCPELDQYLEEQRIVMEKFLEYMKTPQYVEAVQASIRREQLKREDLIQRRDTLKKSVDQLVDSGVALLRERIHELGVDAATPAAFLDYAKEIVLAHKRKMARCAELETEITNLEIANEQLQKHLETVRPENPDQTPTEDVPPEAPTATSPVTNGAAPAKKSRSRSSRNYSHKRSPAAAGKHQQEDTLKEKEVQMKIDLIVAEAMRVEKAAKCAEKERKAQRSDKKKEKSGAHPNGPLKKRPSGDLPVAIAATPPETMPSPALVAFGASFAALPSAPLQKPESAPLPPIHMPTSLLATGDSERIDED